MQMEANTRRFHSPCCQSLPWTFKCLLCLILTAEGFCEGNLGSSSFCLHSSDICRRVRKMKKEKKRLARSGLLAGRHIFAGISSARWSGTAVCFVFAVLSSEDAVHKRTWWWVAQLDSEETCDTQRLDIFFCLFHFSLISVYNLILLFFLSYFLFLFFSTAQWPSDKYLSGSWQAALHPGGMGQEDPPLFRAAAGRPSHPSASRCGPTSQRPLHPLRKLQQSFQRTFRIFIPKFHLPLCTDSLLFAVFPTCVTTVLLTSPWPTLRAL